jgi:hypothetical protein
MRARISSKQGERDHRRRGGEHHHRPEGLFTQLYRDAGGICLLVP